jgi:hypothetical protein
MSKQRDRKSEKSTKSSVKRRTVNLATSAPPEGSPFNDQDEKRRLGTFTGAGEAPRKGSRSAGIVGQTKRTFRTDNKSG